MHDQHREQPTTQTPARRLRPLRGHLWALVVLLASVGSVFALWRMAYERELRVAEAAFVARTEEVAELIRQQLVNYELVGGGGTSLFASVERPTPQQWYGYVEGMELSRRFPGMVGLGFAGYLRGSRVGDLQEEWSNAGWGTLDVRPEGERENYGPILYLEPRTAENVAAIGFDMFSEPTRREAMLRAMETGEPALSGPVNLVQDPLAQSTGLLLYLPVYRGDIRPVTPQARREAMLGWVYMPFKLEQLVGEVLAPREQRDARFRIYDVSGDDAALLYTTSAEPDSQAPAFRHHTELDLHGRRWRVEFDSPPVAAAAPRLKNLQSTLAVGLFASLLMYAIAWMLARTESRAHAIAVRMTGDYRRSEQRFRTAMEYSAIGKVLLDSEGVIVEANKAFSTIVGRTPEALVGVGFHTLFEDDGETSPATTDTRQAMKDLGEGVRRETRRLHRQGGEPRHAQLTYAPLPSSVEQDIAGLVQVEDVTERLRAEARVHALNRTLEARVALRTRELSQANQELEAFAYSVSHDLRAPLRAIDGFSKVLAERYAVSLDEAGLGYLERVRNAAGRMGELIDALLKMSRVGRSPLNRERVDLSRMAHEVIDELRAGDREYHVEAVVEPGLLVEGDPTLLRSLLVNLLGNAWKFTRGVDHPRVEFGREGDEFIVRDNGAGFAQEYVDKLFRPFQRLHDQTDFAGHGIGLASVKRIVERHGGSIRAAGREGQGATFYFTLPGAVESV